VAALRRAGAAHSGAHARGHQLQLWRLVAVEAPPLGCRHKPRVLLGDFAAEHAQPLLIDGQLTLRGSALGLQLGAKRLALHDGLRVRVLVQPSPWRPCRSAPACASWQPQTGRTAHCTPPASRWCASHRARGTRSCCCPRRPRCEPGCAGAAQTCLSCRSGRSGRRPRQRRQCPAAPPSPQSADHGTLLYSSRVTYTSLHSSSPAGGILPPRAREEAALLAAAYTSPGSAPTLRSSPSAPPAAQARSALPRAPNGDRRRVSNGVAAARRPRRCSAQRRWSQPRPRRRAARRRQRTTVCR
jgi:hypothetical protein